MSNLVTALHAGKLLVMDGAMGTELQRLSGSTSFDCCERFNLENPDLVRAIHRSYVDAGADVLLTNTFQANPTALARAGLDRQFHAIWQSAIRRARDAGPSFVLADVGPLPECTSQIVAAILAECVEVDGVLAETWSSFADAMRFAEGCKLRGLPFLVSFTFHRTDDLRTHDSATPEECARAANRWGGAVLGANCGMEIGMGDLGEIARRYRSACELPIFVKPNAGTPVKTASGWSYPLSPQALAAELPSLVDAGIAMIGGCCGTTPEHVRQLRSIKSQAWPHSSPQAGRH